MFINGLVFLRHCLASKLKANLQLYEGALLMAAKKDEKILVPEITAGLKLRMEEDEYTVYEKARVVGSRALQISQGAKPLVDLTTEELEGISYNPIEIAKIEFDRGLVPLTVKRRLPHEKVSPAPSN